MQAIEQNNTGAERFASGDLTGALEAFRGALSLVPAHMAPRADPQGAPLAAAPPALMPASMGVTFMQASQQTLKFSVDEAEESFIYDKALTFSQALPDSQDGAAAFCGVVVFNMALAFDTKGEKHHSSLNKTKALQLYEASIGLLSGVSSRVDLVGAVAAACNNKARIHFEQSNFEDCKYELHRLHAYMMLADQSPSKGDILVDDDAQGIFLNMLLLSPPITAHAA